MSKKKRLSDTPPPESPWGFALAWTEAIEELNRESDRAVALLGAAYLDDALKDLVASSLAGGKVVADKLLNGPNAPLGTFSARIAISHGLGLIGPHYFAALEAVREIRNAFAHFRRDMTFESTEVREWIVTNFRIPYVLPDPAPDLSLMRNRYIWTTAMILGQISWARRHAKPAEFRPNS